MTRCVVLVSVGSHPLSRRARLAHQDGAAIAVAAAMGEAPLLLHAGPAEHQRVLRAGLGMGGAGLEILALSPEGDPFECLADRLLAHAPRLILSGTRADLGEGRGLLAYVLA